MTDVLQRLAAAVKSSPLSENDLACELGIHRTTLSRYLNGHMEMPAKVMIGLMEALGLRFEDLERNAEALDRPRVLLRADHPSVIKQRFFPQTLDRLRFYARAIEELHLSYPLVRLPERIGTSVEKPEEIEEAALETRRVLHLPERGPVTGLFTSLSRAIKIVGFKTTGAGMADCDGFTVSDPDFGLGIAVNSILPFERCLATVAHELGHAVLHPNDFAPPDKAPRSSRSKDSREKVAWAFAGEFLVPSADIRELFFAYVGPRGTLPSSAFVTRVKHLYGISAHLLLVRMLREKLIAEWQFGKLKKWFYPEGSKDERSPLPESASWEVFGSPQAGFEDVVARMYFEQRISESRVAELLDLTAEEAENWITERYDAFGVQGELSS